MLNCCYDSKVIFGKIGISKLSESPMEYAMAPVLLLAMFILAKINKPAIEVAFQLEKENAKMSPIIFFSRVYYDKIFLLRRCFASIIKIKKGRIKCIHFIIDCALAIA